VSHIKRLSQQDRTDCSDLDDLLPVVDVQIVAYAATNGADDFDARGANISALRQYRVAGHIL
jgi:hypothetical protein